MSGLWTPYGEHEPRPEPPPGGAAPPPGAPEGPPGGEELDEATLREMVARLAATPVEVIVAQFAVELREVAALHLGLAGGRPESLEAARLAVDAMGALVEGLGARLGPNAAPLQQALADLRLAFVQVSGSVTGGPPEAGREPGQAEAHGGPGEPPGAG